jgi:hypothetical protein
MRVLCDQNVPRKYADALRDVDGISVGTVADELEHDAADPDIASHAEATGAVLLTNDDDFYVDGQNHGLLFYSQVEAPTPGAVAEAVRRIRDAYESDAEILENVPDGWV